MTRRFPTNHARVLGALYLLLWIPARVSACGSCLGSLALSGAGVSGSISSTKSKAAARTGTPQHHRHALPPTAQASAGIAGVRKFPAGRSPISKSALGLIAIRQFLSRADFAAMLAKSRMSFAFESSDNAASDSRASSNSDKREAAKDITSNGGDSASSQNPDALEDLLSDDNYETPEQRGVDPEYMARSKEGRMTAGMTGAIGFYKGWISPILPPACRFVPTCSQYGVQAIQEFGPAKGALLTAWRLMRCSPLGGKGYDPPRWPPVPYNYASY